MSLKLTPTQDQWIKVLPQGRNIRGVALSATHLIENARQRHGLAGLETQALGESLIAGLLLASRCKADERVSLSLKGEGRLKQTIVDANPDGTARGFITTRDVTATTSSIPTSKKVGPWQKGLLSVVRLLSNQTEPYVGTCELVTGHLAKDLTYYLNQSEQVPSAVGLAVNLDQKGRVASASGFLVEMMPGASERDIAALEKNLKKLGNFSQLVATDGNPTSVLTNVLNDMAFTILEQKPLFFQCTCSRARVLRALKILGVTELLDMAEKDNGSQIHCDFCNTSFNVTRTELESLAAALAKHK